MTDPRHLSPADLEAVSAHLDGEATAEESARVEADPGLRAAVDRLRAVRDHLTIDLPPEAVVESRIAAALAAFDTGPSTAPVVDLAAERERRWYHRVPLGAVAAALLAVAVVGAITQIDVDSGDDTATAADASGEDAGDAGQAATEESVTADAGAGTGGAAASGTTAAPLAAGALEFATMDELAEHVAGEVATGAARSQDADDAGGDGAGSAPEDEAADDTAAFGDPAGCDAVGATGSTGTPVAVLPAVVAGRPVTAVVVEADGSRRLLVVDDETCAVVDDRVLQP